MKKAPFKKINSNQQHRKEIVVVAATPSQLQLQ